MYVKLLFENFLTSLFKKNLLSSKIYGGFFGGLNKIG